MTEEKDRINRESDKVPHHEAVERPWATNDKDRYDLHTEHTNRMSILGELAMQNAVETQALITKDYLEGRDKRETERLKYGEAKHVQAGENNRFSLDRLYGVFPEEAPGVVAIAKALEQLLQEQTPKKA